MAGKHGKSGQGTAGGAIEIGPGRKIGSQGAQRSLGETHHVLAVALADQQGPALLPIQIAAAQTASLVNAEAGIAPR